MAYINKIQVQNKKNFYTKKKNIFIYIYICIYIYDSYLKMSRCVISHLTLEKNKKHSTWCIYSDTLYLFNMLVNITIYLSQYEKSVLRQRACFNAKYKLSCKCFLVNFMEWMYWCIEDVLKNLLGGVFLDIKLLIMCVGLITFQYLVLRLLTFLSDIISIKGFSRNDPKLCVHSTSLIINLGKQPQTQSWKCK